MVIADTGFWLALANKSDKHHRRATRHLQTLREPLITTWPVVAETCHLLLTRIGNRAQCAFLASGTKGAYEIFELARTDMPYIVELMEKYANLPMDLADASLVLLAERLGDGRILSTDQRDFQAYRWKRHKPFDNLLLP